MTKRYLSENEDLMKEWDFEANKDLDPNLLTISTKKKAWWKCSKCDYKWYATIGNRTRNHTGCPLCANKIVIIGTNDLATTHPNVVKEWNYKKNAPLLPQQVSYGSNKKVWWQCNKCGYEWITTINQRVHDNCACPVCCRSKAVKGVNDLTVTNPNILKDWDYNKNTDIQPDNLKSSSSKRVWWKCSKCGYEWKTSCYQRVLKNSGCPFCSNKTIIAGINDFVTIYSDIAKEWNYLKNINISSEGIHPGSHKKVWWKCGKCGYEYEKSIRQRIKSGCPKCNDLIIISGVNDLATTNPEIAKEWHPTKNGNLTPKDVKANSSKKVWWQCSNRHHEWETEIRWRTQLDYGCPKCSSSRQTSFPEQAIFYYVKKIFPDAINRYKSPFLGKMELDIYIPSIQIAIEYDGEAWHKKEKEVTEIKKYEACKANGIYLIRFKENNKKDFTKVADKCYSLPNLSHSLKMLEKLIWHLLLSIDVSITEMITPITSDETDSKYFNKDYYSPICKSYDIDIERDKLKIKSRYLTTSYNKNLEVLYPNIAKEWHPTKNEGLTPDKFSVGSKDKVWWKCSKCGYEWTATINHRVCCTSGCPCCANKVVVSGVNDLATTHPEIAKNWYYLKNAPITPKNISYGSGKVYWWKCIKCGYEWKTSPNRITSSKSTCPQCTNKKLIKGVNDLSTTYPEIAQEWNVIKNDGIIPFDIKAGSHKKVWWKCSKCGYEWQAEIRKRVKGFRKCPNCNKNNNQLDFDF